MTISRGTRKECMLGVISFFLGAVFVFLFYQERLGLNFPIFAFLVALSGLFLIREFNGTLLRDHYIVLGCALFFAGMVYVRSSELLTFFNVVGSGLLFFAVITSLNGTSIRQFQLQDYITLPLTPLRFIGPFFETFPKIISIQSLTPRNSQTKEILRGSILAIIAVSLFSWLFSSADLVFGKLIGNIFDFTIDMDTRNEILLLLFISAFFIGAFGFLFYRKESTGRAETPEIRYLGELETMILFSSINLLFFLFIIIQISYLFADPSHIFAMGLNYATYAQDGFSQLVLVSLLSLSIIFFTESRVTKQKDTHRGAFKILSGIMILQVILILVSAFSRLTLYEEAYGFTTIRLFSHAFMIWVSITLALLALFIAKGGKQTVFYFRVGCSVVVMLFLMNIVNPDAFIAKQNIARYEATGHIDAYYLGTLSSDALPFTVSLLKSKEKEVREQFASALYWQSSFSCREDSCNKENSASSWKSSRKNSHDAIVLLSPYRDLLKQSANIYERDITDEDRG